MQPLQCGSQHQLANLHLSTHRTTPEQQMTRVMQPFQCDLQPEIPKHPTTTHTQAHPKQLQAAVTLRQKKKRKTDPSRTRRTHEVPVIAGCSHFTRKTQGFVPRLPPQNYPHAKFMQPFQCDLQPQLQIMHRTTHIDTTTCCRTQRYLSSPAAATWRGKTQGFVLRLPPQLTTCLRHRFPSSPLPIITTSLPHHFPSSPHPIVTTSLRPFPFLTTSLPHHFPSSPPPFLTASHRHHLPSSPPCVIASLFYVMYHPSSRSTP